MNPHCQRANSFGWTQHRVHPNALYLFLGLTLRCSYDRGPSASMEHSEAPGEIQGLAQSQSWGFSLSWARHWLLEELPASPHGSGAAACLGTSMPSFANAHVFLPVVSEVKMGQKPYVRCFFS